MAFESSVECADAYTGDFGKVASSDRLIAVSLKVLFDKPYVTRLGSGDFAPQPLRVVVW